MSLCFLRSVSPIHIQYLKNMGVAATLVVSLMVGGRLWGLVSCHHYSPRFLHFELRSVCEAAGRGDRHPHRGAGKLSPGPGRTRGAPAGTANGGMDVPRRRLARGAVRPFAAPACCRSERPAPHCCSRARSSTTGDVPATEQIREIARWVGPKLERGLFRRPVSASEEPRFAAHAGVASGIVAERISGEADEMLIWFRTERVRTVTWGGNPFKSPSVGDDPKDLSPRRSFAQWQQIVKGTPIPGLRPTYPPRADRRQRHRRRDAVPRGAGSDGAGPARSGPSPRSRVSDQQIVVADAQGSILECNAAFSALLGAGHDALRGLEDLPDFFADPDEAQTKAERSRSRDGPGAARRGSKAYTAKRSPSLVRADAVARAPDRALGLCAAFHGPH